MASLGVLRILIPKRLRFVDNYSRLLDAHKYNTLRIILPVRKIISRGTTSITLSGSVKDGAGVALVGRVVRVFADGGMSILLGVTYSDSSGNFSVTVPGTTTQKFTIVALAEFGENTQVFTNVVH